MNEQVTITALVAAGSYTGFGWGGSMTNTEMVIFSGDDSTATSSINFYYSLTEGVPSPQVNLDDCYNN